ncbi:MAG: TlpA family protein disulfide reductase [Pirellulaceae bacterium]|nr:TlpA family protein disulfide reductase [Pirellulaceae bacterium]
MRRKPQALLGWLVLLAGALLHAGCGSDTGPVTAETSKFRPAGSGDKKAEDSAAAVPAEIESALDQENMGFASGAEKPPVTPPVASGEVAVADGSVAQLSAQIDQLGQRAQQATSEQEFTSLMNARVAAVEKLLEKDLDEQTQTQAVTLAMQTFALMEQVGIPGTRGKVLTFATNLAKSKKTDLSRLGRQMLFSIDVGESMNRSPDDATDVVARVDEFLKAESAELSPDSLAQAAGVADQLLQAGLQKDALAVLKMAGDTAAASKDPAMAAIAETYRDRAVLVELDLQTLARNLMAGEPDAEKKLLESVQGALGKMQPSGETVKQLIGIAEFLDIVGKNSAARQTMAMVDEVLAKGGDKIPAEVKAQFEKASLRTKLVGEPFSVEGVIFDPEGAGPPQPFDWSAYAGKVVLVDFWASWCGPCIEELPNIRANYDEFHDLGFDVVGVNLDTDPDMIKRFFAFQKLPWVTVASADVLAGKVTDKAPDAFHRLPMAEKFGIEGIPFLVLVGKDGKVDSLHVRGEKLRSRLVALLGEPPAKPAGDTPPAGEKASPAATEPAATEPAAPPATEPAPAEPAPPAAEPAAEPAPEQGAMTPVGIALAAALLGAEEPAAEAAKSVDTADDTSINPYTARPGLSSEELVNFVLKMLDKPQTIQGRPGFAEAVCEACNRIMTADPPAKEVHYFIAAETKLATLHKQAVLGNAEADKQLMEFVTSLAADERPRIARQVAFFQQERKVLDAVEAPLADLPAFLKSLEEYYAKEPLTARHLRMASTTVALINRLESGDEREQHFAKFGELYAKSSDKALAKYGKKIAKKPAATESDLVGQPLELGGSTAKGGVFAWEAYRGKVVLVDFWATWCGPCRREMPNVKALAERLGPQGFEVVGVSLDEDQEALAAYLEENAIAWETLAGEGTQDLAEKYSVRGIPTMMLVDREGKIVAVAHNVAALTPLAEKLLGGE